MEQKLSFLLDRTQPFTQERVALLDQLTVAMNSNSPQVLSWSMDAGSGGPRNLEATERG